MQLSDRAPLCSCSPNFGPDLNCQYHQVTQEDIDRWHQEQKKHVEWNRQIDKMREKLEESERKKIKNAVKEAVKEALTEWLHGIE